METGIPIRAPMCPPINRHTRRERSCRRLLPLSPIPCHERQRAHPPSHAASRGREPRQLPARTVRRTRRSGPDATQTHLSGFDSDGLTPSVRYRRAVRFKRIGVGQPGPVKAGWRVRVAYDLATRQRAAHQNRSGVVAQVFGLVGPSGDEGAKVHACRHHVFVEVERREAVRWIPATAVALRGGGIERVRPGRIDNSPPDMCVRYRLAQQLHGQACVCSNRNIPRHVASNVRVSPRASRPTREASSSAWIGLRTTAGIRSRLR